MNKNHKPFHFAILKVAGFLGVILAVVAFVLIFTGFGDFESNNFMIGAMLLPFGMIIASIGLLMGFKPEIVKMQTKSIKYIQEENKDDLAEIAETSADIAGEAITKTAKAVSDGFEEKMFCRHCGERIPADSKFCKKCGREQ